MAGKLLTVEAAAARLGLDRQDVVAMVRAGRLHGIVADGLLRVAEQDVAALLAWAAAPSREQRKAGIRAVVPPESLTDDERATFFSTACHLPKINLAVVIVPGTPPPGARRQR